MIQNTANRDPLLNLLTAMENGAIVTAALLFVQRRGGGR